MAHELNQPLTAILGNVASLQPDAQRRFWRPRESVRMRRHHCGRQTCGEVINGLRVLLKKGMSQLAPVDLNELVSDALRLVRNDSLLQQVTVKFEYPTAFPACLATASTVPSGAEP